MVQQKAGIAQEETVRAGAETSRCGIIAVRPPESRGRHHSTKMSWTGSVAGIGYCQIAQVSGQFPGYHAL